MTDPTQTDSSQPQPVGVLGLGLIGGSLLRRLAGSLPVCGYDADPDVRRAAREAGFEVYDTAAEVVARTALAVLAVPLPALPALVPQVTAAAQDGLVVTDVVSVKDPVRDLLAGTGLAYVGGHPMAGTERSGFGASDRALFTGAAWVLCLEPDTSLEAWLAVARLVTSIGARAVPCRATEHDDAVARISLLPHLAAAVVADAAAGDPLALALGAGSFRDVTRVAATPPALTAAMCAGNRTALVAELDLALARLEEARRLLASGTDLVPWLRRAHAVRTAWPPAAGPGEVLESGPGLRERLLELGRAGGAVTGVAGRRVEVTR